MSRRGQRRHENRWSRTLALFDELGVTKRRCDMRARLSRETHQALVARAADLGVYPAGLAAYIVEKALRERDSGYEEFRDREYGKEAGRP